MGISGLLPLLKDIQSSKNISSYRGLTLGIDAYVWLHRGAYGCAQEIVKDPTCTRYLSFAIHRIRMLRHHGVTPYIIFDGDRLPSKGGTEVEREQRRNEALAKARALESEGRFAEARDAYTKCVDITPEMAYQLIKILKREGVSYVVAPYEADAQLAYLEQEGLIDGIVTEDSDLLVFGCRRVLFKLQPNGDCIEILQSKFSSNRQLVFSGWSSVEFRQMAILSGCDYLPSIVGMGLKNAHRLLRRYKTVDRVLQAIRLEGKMKVPLDYAKEFRRAELTFVHQRVWDPRKRCMTTLTPLPDGTLDDMVPFIGAPISDEEAAGITCGDIDPISREPMRDLAPQIGRLVTTSEIELENEAGASSRDPRTSFYGSNPKPKAKKVVNESGLQSIKGFFSAKNPGSEGGSQASRPPQARANIKQFPPRTAGATAQSPSKVSFPQGLKHSNSAPDVFCKPGHQADQHAPLKRQKTESDLGFSQFMAPRTSKFFANRNGTSSPGTKETSAPTPAPHPYLELGGVQGQDREVSRDDPSYWDQCDDVGELLVPSPRRQRAGPSSSPLATPKDSDTPEQKAPAREREGKGKEDVSGGLSYDDDEADLELDSAECDRGDDSDLNSGVISSPASSIMPGEPSSPASPCKVRSWTGEMEILRHEALAGKSLRSIPEPCSIDFGPGLGPVAGSDPIEADEDEISESPLLQSSKAFRTETVERILIQDSDEEDNAFTATEISRNLRERYSFDPKGRRGLASVASAGLEARRESSSITPSRAHAFLFASSNPRSSEQHDNRPMSIGSSKGRRNTESCHTTPRPATVTRPSPLQFASSSQMTTPSTKNPVVGRVRTEPYARTILGSSKALHLNSIRDAATEEVQASPTLDRAKRISSLGDVARDRGLGVGPSGSSSGRRVSENGRAFLEKFRFSRDD
ncbi:hypothetical protein IE53DRAFT_110312 [Violaceomyces palustris]|uniref:Uncharacterized protein n=1 Tax=Violaceomyces palustris TaxID=1673888 RepID=A0ACD0NWH0_9BASI|nr:hypothetical protein IE53DRAFT_110312 [Violaceomyces palustris]